MAYTFDTEASTGSYTNDSAAIKAWDDANVSWDSSLIAWDVISPNTSFDSEASTGSYTFDPEG